MAVIWAEAALTTIVNARAVAEPEAFRALVEDAILDAGRTVGAGFAIERMDCFSPARPVPRHRMAGPSGL